MSCYIHISIVFEVEVLLQIGPSIKPKNFILSLYHGLGFRTLPTHYGLGFISYTLAKGTRVATFSKANVIFLFRHTGYVTCYFRQPARERSGPARCNGPPLLPIQFHSNVLFTSS